MRRSKKEIVERILEICKEPSGRTKIVYQANTNFYNVDYYLPRLINAGLLEASGTMQVTYKITPKGLDFLEHLKVLDVLLKLNNKKF